MRSTIMCSLILVTLFATMAAWGQGIVWADVLNQLIVNPVGGAPAVGTIVTGGGRQPTVMELTDQGLIVITNGVLARYDAKTLEAKGTVDLLGPLPEAPQPPTALDDLQLYFQDYQLYTQELAKWRETPVMTTLGQYLLVVLGDQFYRIDSETMTIEVQASVEAEPADGADPLPPLTGVTPILSLHGTMLYVLRSNRVSAIEIKEGKVMAATTLPAEMVGGVAAVRPPAVGGGGVVVPPTTPVATPTTLVGTIVNHDDLEGGFYTVKLDNGDEYVLAGTALEKLLLTPNIEGKRVRLTGTTSNQPGIAQYGKGYFNLTAYQILG
jgi:hypothetical protein